MALQDADIHWKEYDEKYHFSCQFTADLIAMNVRTSAPLLKLCSAPFLGTHGRVLLRLKRVYLDPPYAVVALNNMPILLPRPILSLYNTRFFLINPAQNSAPKKRLASLLCPIAAVNESPILPSQPFSRLHMTVRREYFDPPSELSRSCARHSPRLVDHDCAFAQLCARLKQST